MTLYRQLLIFTLVLFLLLFAGTWVAKLNSTRVFLLDQLESHVQDTATYMGLSISPHMEENELATVETMINAVFDRGYYRIIRLLDIEDNVLVDRTMEIQIEGVPHWFIKMVPLPTSQATAMVLTGWRQAGKVLIESHPGYAYKTLWDTALSTSIWFLFMESLVLIGGGLGIRVLLKPLKRIEHQADSLCNRQYEIQEILPKTRELRRVVEAMNRMTYKVRDMFDEQANIAERFRHNAYHDALTGLGNRRYLEGQVSARLARGESTVKGAFLLIQLIDLQELNQKKGFRSGDALLQKICVKLKNATSHIPNSALARLTGGDFGLFLPDTVIEDVSTIAETVVKKMAQLSIEGLTLSENVGHIGGVIYSQPTTFGQLLSGADTALRAAQQDGYNRWKLDPLAEDSGSPARGEQRWKDILTEALTDKNIVLFFQPTVHSQTPDKIFHLEVFSRIKENSGKMLSAGVFIPLAERLGLVSSFDRIVIEHAMMTTTEILGVDQLAVNISPSSLHDDDFRAWILSSLQNLPKTAPKIMFEFAEFGAVQNLDLIQTFGAEVQQLGHGYGLDHFGQGFTNFGYLKSLRPDYVKIDRAYTDELKTRDSDSYFFICSLMNVAHSLDISVIAEGVENEEQFDLLKEIKLDAIQGYFIDKPKPISRKQQI